ncbi:30S ribosomal protein S6 [Calderihabitans maritimus]|uniref:Small ribosomal subunit protein bS6 n=1 Tax=Calderihabitans maritimus TaxID=1246530 RepID=A0A1Z5HVY6_9FIRM|nr:30S ribosomal protein S6 [Calderihabitans maritimus]GAW93709.1 30S ribosomal protein S6 [Calderihabitans maritimus]
MRVYETMYIIRPNLEEEQTTAVMDRFASLIKDNGGEVIKVEPWGARKLAYEIEKYREGYYVLMHFKGEPAVAQELERVFKISDEVIRYLIVRLDEKEMAS